MDDIKPLSNEEIEQCRVAFNKFDKDGSGSIADWELKQMLQCTLRARRRRMRDRSRWAAC